MQTNAIVLTEPRCIAPRELALVDAGPDDVTVAVAWSAISSGTERLLYTGRMPAFPGMGYPLVPGYEAVGRIVAADAAGTFQAGDTVFVPGSTAFKGARGLFGASASHLVVPAARVAKLEPALGERGVLLALAATAAHTLGKNAEPRFPELIVGHGALGRLLARLVIALGGTPPTVWECDPARHAGAEGYEVVDPARDGRRDYRAITDVSGDPAVLDTLVSHLAPGGEICLAGFYAEPVSFAFPPAFMREARLRIAAQWQREDLDLVRSLAQSGALSLDGLITHRAAASDAGEAYATAFGDRDCLKMVLDWRASA
ncbi:2-desacetyl-2-hydroxyethyl bacteriochlorophyllide A dehydrogenase [Beijerinckiaceae bacterium RH AL1]|nr:chlorophyll synthesis pathway protein BchC [Beijerinckiaceae bacterium]VVB47836.1 2-desacetyl-2-hydroxyethyl bacteriochlorophyllide A dehydrogenase [Beijerinckiaceae bacterium RH CH11]VVB47914.1 2-desacetyl-2-hydroxyethyl bacteriochlorophyllide A dehydrogenase [Beijerinckiaceae bacterium RH AL8]VVC56089.1 2-desacetyl-2-hydroxyethyl bacteriochlorophyllide A dehydrogenase [Beijerinckiaceae bacterium RH AL1]